MATYIDEISFWCLYSPRKHGEKQMPRKSPFEIHLNAEERRILEARAPKYTLPYFEVLRARMILLAAEGR